MSADGLAKALSIDNTVTKNSIARYFDQLAFRMYLALRGDALHWQAKDGLHN